MGEFRPSVFPVILSGGAGTRLWPLSRAMYPKQFIQSLNGHDASLLGATLTRLKPEAGFSPPILLCNNDHRFLARDEIERSGAEAKAIILEPSARNTAPAVAVAALAVESENPSAILAVMPSDHVIVDQPLFVEKIKRAANVARMGKLVLFGVTPHEPHTGYGYIRRGGPLQGFEPDVFAIAAFCEKPNVATAQSYLAQGGYYWNSGIFVLPVRQLIEEFERLAPDILTAARGALARAEADLGFLKLERLAFNSAPNMSIDCAIMEKTTAAVVLPLESGWSDLGSWSALWRMAARDRDGNHVHGDALLEESRNCYIRSERALVSGLGIENLMIVDTPDALLVADKSRAEDVSKIVSRLKQSNRPEHQQHTRSHQSWGYIETLSLGPQFQVKLLHVKPGGKFSLHMHRHRSEHWVVVQGTAKVTIRGVEKLVGENESVSIVATEWYRLENPGKVPLEIIEVQLGTYLGEDDIQRVEDVYRPTADETQ